MKPIDLKKIAQRFTSKYYPQWVSRVDRIWNMFEKIDLNQILSESTTSQYQLGNAFGITGTTEPEFNECISGIAILAFTYKNVKDEDDVSEKDIKKQISIVPVSPKITTDIRQKLEDVLGEMLSSNIEGVIEEKNDAEVQKLKSLDENYAKIWTNETSSEYLLIDKHRFEGLNKKKSNYDIFIVDNGEYYRKTVGKVYFRGSPMFPQPKTKKNNEVETITFTPLPYRLLVYTLKLKGSPGEVFDLLEFCWFEKVSAERLRKKHKNSHNEIIDIDKLHESASKVRKAASKLSTNFLIDYFGIELTTSKTSFYSLNKLPKYCYVELS
jgi:hypothetical protein